MTIPFAFKRDLELLIIMYNLPQKYEIPAPVLANKILLSLQEHIQEIALVDWTKPIPKQID